VVAELLGWFGAGLSCVISLPQVVRTVRAKQLEGISSATYWLVLANAAAWTAWSLFTGEYAGGVPALVNGPVAIVILHRLAVARHDTPDPRVQQCVQPSDVPPNPGVEHLDPGLFSSRVWRWLCARRPSGADPSGSHVESAPWSPGQL
jgi:uncharacterized protein with PQ loop repeat